MKKKRFQMGTRPDGSPWHFRLLPLKKKGKISVAPITAVCALVTVGDKIVAVKNPRGWDLPGGHIEKGESLFEALEREVKEEAGVAILKAKPVALLDSDLKPNRLTYIVIYQAEGVLEEFTREQETEERALLLPDQFLKKFSGNKELMRQIFQLIDPNL